MSLWVELLAFSPMVETEAETISSESIAAEAPGAETVPETKTVAARSRRYKFYPDGNDVVLLSVQVDPKTGEPVPNGALAAIPDVPRFPNATEAKRWVEQSGEQLQGLTVLVVRMQKKLRCTVEARPSITVIEDPRYPTDVGPETPEE